MSRIGRLPVAIPAGVTVEIKENNHVTVKGPKGTLERVLPAEMEIKQEDGHVVVTRPNDLKKMKSLHGLTRTLIQNMVVGVSEGYTKTLEVNGVGYRAAKQGNKLVLIGDKAQLPPVGLDISPALSHEYIANLGESVWSELVTVVRQQAGSGILKNATALRELLRDAGDYGADDINIVLDIRGYDDIERIDGSELIEKLADAYSRYGDDGVVVICRSNRRAIKYNLGIRSAVQFKEESLVRGDRLMIVKNCYQFVENLENVDYIANGDIAMLESISGYEERYGLHFAKARLSFPDYDSQEITANVIFSCQNAYQMS